MSSPPPSSPPTFAPLLWLERVGAALLILMGSLVPVFVVPLKYLPDFRTEESEQANLKLLLLQALSAGVLILVAVALLTPLWKRLFMGSRIATVAFGAFAIWGCVSVAASPAPKFSLIAWIPTLMLIAAATLGGPLFLCTRRRVEALLVAIMLGAAVVAAIGSVSGLGVRSINREIYGADPRDQLEDRREDRKARVEGGFQRSGSLSTLLNPEWAGSYLAITIALGIGFLADWAPRHRRRVILIPAVLALLAMMGLHMLLTGSRQPVVAVGLVMLLRLLLAAEIRGRYVVLGFSTPLVAMIALGPPIAAAIAALELVVLIVWLVTSGRLAGLWRATPKLLRVASIGAPVIGVGLLTIFSTPNPLNPMGLRIASRFTSFVTGADSSMKERLTMNLLSSDMVRQNPVAGIGPGRYANEFSTTFAVRAAEDETGVLRTIRDRLRGQQAKNAHNDFLQTAAEFGLPGLVLLLTGIVALLQFLLTSLRAQEDESVLAAMLICGIAGLLAMMLTSFPLQTPSRMGVAWGMFAAALGLAVARERRLAEANLR